MLRWIEIRCCNPKIPHLWNLLAFWHASLTLGCCWDSWLPSPREDSMKKLILQHQRELGNDRKKLSSRLKNDLVLERCFFSPMLVQVWEVLGYRITFKQKQWKIGSTETDFLHQIMVPALLFMQSRVSAGGRGKCPRRQTQAWSTEQLLALLGFLFTPVLIPPPTQLFGMDNQINVEIFMLLGLRLNYIKYHFWLASGMRSRLHFGHCHIFSILEPEGIFLGRLNCRQSSFTENSTVFLYLIHKNK